MAATMAHMSMLPAITCSNCGADVDLAMMGDHVCGAPRTDVPPVPSLYDRLPMTQPDLSYPHEHHDADLSPQNQPTHSDTSNTRPNNVVVTTPSGGHRMNLGPVGTAVPPRNMSPITSADSDNTYSLPPAPEHHHPPLTSTAGYSQPDPSPVASTTNPYFWQAPSQNASVDDLSVSPAATSPASAPADSLLDPVSPYSPVIPSPLSAPEPLADRPDSAAIFQQFARTDSLVPPPPPARSAARPKPPPSPLNLLPERTVDEAQLAPLSPMPNGANVLRRMDTIAPGPFDSRHKKSDSRDAGGKGFSIFRRKSNKKKKASISGPTALMDAPPLPMAEPSLFVGGSMESSSPIEQHHQSPKVDDFGQPLPSGPAPPRPARPGEVDGLFETLQSGNSDISAEYEVKDNSSYGPLESDRSPSEHSDQALRDLTRNLRDSSPATPNTTGRITSDTSIYTTVSSSDRSTTFGKELPQIREDEDREAEGEADVDAPPAWPTGRLRSASRSTEGTKPKAEPVPPMPNINGSEELGSAMQPQHHTPTESLSSQDFGSVSDGRRESSRSSPPTSTASSFSPSKQSMDDQRDIHHAAGEMSSSAALNRAANFSRPRAPTESSTASPPRAFVEPASPLPPNQAGMSKPAQANDMPGPSPPKLAAPPPRKASLAGLQLPPRSTSRSPRYAGPGTFSDAPPSPMFPRSPRFPPPPPVPSTERRLNAPRKSSGATKSCCRGCDLPIEGKSVKASDGRLTGRYHRECFVCKACKERFPTADFYILEDHPYCAQHYHELNGSICVDCGRGIEGRYIDTTGDRKHHIYCFTCTDCSKPLSQDYFEIDGKFYCEADAGKVHQKSSMLAPGRKFPERRTTRLMMM